MSEVKWIKITTTMFDDEKIDFIESLPEADSILVIWIKLLTLAGKCNMNGYIFLTENIPYNDEMLAHKFKRPLNTVRLALETLTRLDMIEMDNGIYITNWDKHQNIGGLEKIRENTRQRVARHRQLKALEGNVSCNVTATHGNASDIEEDIELDIDREKDLNNISPSEREILHVLKSVMNYPFQYEKDLAFVRMLIVDYPDIDVLEQAKRWATYKLDKPLEKKSNPRSQLRTWFNKSKEFQQKNQSNTNYQQNVQQPINITTAQVPESVARLQRRFRGAQNGN